MGGRGEDWVRHTLRDVRRELRIYGSQKLTHVYLLLEIVIQYLEQLDDVGMSKLLHYRYLLQYLELCGGHVVRQRHVLGRTREPRLAQETHPVLLGVPALHSFDGLGGSTLLRA